MNYVIGLLLTLGILIVVHEWGHYRMARACGVRVQRFSIGFGKVLWRRQKSADDTEFVLCALPLGGYVKMLDGREGEVPEAQRHEAFNTKPLSQRAAIVAAGPLANLVLAVLLFAAAYAVGVREVKAVLGSPAAGSLAERAGLRAGDWVQAVRAEDRGASDSAWREVTSLSDLHWHLTQAAADQQALRMQVSDGAGRQRRELVLDLTHIDPKAVDAGLGRHVGLGGPHQEAVMGDVRAGGPAASAGLRLGDRVLAVDGQPVADAARLRERIRAAAQAPGAAANMPTQRWQLERSGQVMELDVTPRRELQGELAIGRIDAIVGTPVAVVTVRKGLIDGLAAGAERTWDTAIFSLRMLGRILIGQASLKNLSGPISIADYAGQSVEQGPARFLEFLAIVSVSLGVLNLLPLPMLDGGHLMVYIVEALTGRPLSDAWMARLQRGGLAVLLMLMSVALFNDVARLLGLN